MYKNRFTNSMCLFKDKSVIIVTISCKIADTFNVMILVISKYIVMLFFFELNNCKLIYFLSYIILVIITVYRIRRD